MRKNLASQSAEGYKMNRLGTNGGLVDAALFTGKWWDTAGQIYKDDQRNQER
jgi:hypothetical protein